jgi:hypothetical protein
MKQLRFIWPLLLVLIVFYGHACTAELTPEQKQVVADLKQDLGK